MIEDTINELEKELKGKSAIKRETAKVILKNLYFDSKWYEFSLRRKIIKVLEKASSEDRYSS
jgi:serine protease inhibitor